MPDTNDKYKKKVTVVNDSVNMVGGKRAFYRQDDNSIHVMKGNMNWNDFGFDVKGENKPVELNVIHERQHQINHKKGIYSANMSLNEHYQRGIHDEITALVAEKLELRRQYKSCQTQQDRKAFIDKYSQYPEYKDYISAIATGRINPNSTSTKDYLAEMAFIKDSSIKYRADPTDDVYRKQWTDNALAYAIKNNGHIMSDPQALREDVRKMYNIGGFDFSKVGRQDIYLIENQSIVTADRLLQQGADPQKIARFIRQGEGTFRLAESLDVSGLSRQQAETVLQTAIVTQCISQDIAGDLAMGQTPNYDYDYIARNNRNKIAVYLDMKRDIWEKQGLLSEEGNEDKYNELMQKAKEIQLDPQSWFDNAKSFLSIAKDPAKADELAKLKDRIRELQGQTANLDEVVADKDKIKLPLDRNSLEDVLADIAAKQAEDDAWREKYRNEHPEEFEEHPSDPYDIEVMDLESDMLKDEFEQLQKNESKQQEQSSFSKMNLYNVSIDGIYGTIEVPSYNSAEIKTTIDDRTGNSTQVGFIEGKKHGAEISFDKDGKITDLKMFDNGKEIDLSNHKVDVNIADDENGNKAFTTYLDDNPFGYGLAIDSSGNSITSFYDINGYPINPSRDAETKITDEHIFTEDLTKQMEDAFLSKSEKPDTANSQTPIFLDLWNRPNKSFSLSLNNSSQTSRQTRIPFIGNRDSSER